MAIRKSFSLLLLLLFLQTHLSLSQLNPIRPITSIDDVHDLLPLYGFPKGLLPNNVKSYSLSDTGDFSVELNSPCYVQFDKLVYYSKKFGGKLSYGSVRDVWGIQAKKLFLWVSVTAMELEKSSDMIAFYVGPLSEEFPAKEFQTIPDCKSKGCQLTRLDYV